MIAFLLIMIVLAAIFLFIRTSMCYNDIICDPDEYFYFAGDVEYFIITTSKKKAIKANRLIIVTNNYGISWHAVKHDKLPTSEAEFDALMDLLPKKVKKKKNTISF